MCPLPLRLTGLTLMGGLCGLCGPRGLYGLCGLCAGPGHRRGFLIDGAPKAPRGPEVGAGLVPLGPEPPPLTMVEMPMGVCVTAGLVV